MLVCVNSLVEDGTAVLFVPRAGLHDGRVAEAGEVGQVLGLKMAGVPELNLLDSLPL